MRGKFCFKDGFTYRMPVHFRGWPFDNGNRPVFSDVLMIQAEQQTGMEALAQYVPPEFEILRPSILWAYSNCRGVDFLSNSEYRILQACAPVKFIGGDEEITGVYPLVIFENDAAPVLGGREEDGMPKVWCDISCERRYENHWFACASLNCETMVKVDFHETGAASDAQLKAAQNCPLVNNFGYRFIPHADKGGAAASGPILYPQEFHPTGMWSGEGSFKVIPPDAWYKNPAMFQILAGLAALPDCGFTCCMRARGSIRLCVADSRELQS